MFLELLKRSGLKKKQLADRLGVDPSTVTNWKDTAPQYAIAYLEEYVSDKEHWESKKGRHGRS